ncbi:cell wall protein, partial [Aspergillus rambellii]
MKFQTLLLTVAPALVAAAPAAAAAGTCDSGSGSPSPSPSPAPAPAPVGTNPFGVVAMHSGNAVQYAPFNAAKSSLLAGLKHQNASCDRPGEQTATFYLDDGALFLYDASATPQEIFVDRSGM